METKRGRGWRQLTKITPDTQKHVLSEKKKHSERKEPSHNCSPLRILLTDERMTQQVLDGENAGHLIYLMIRLYQGAASSTDSMIFFSYFITIAFVS